MRRQTKAERAAEVETQKRDASLAQAEYEVGHAIFCYAQLGTESAAGVAKKITALIFAILALAACIGPAPAPVSNACATALGQIIHPSLGFETRWTASEQRQVLDHNNASRQQCPAIH